MRPEVRDELSGSAAAPTGAWPLVGRESELAQITLAQVDDGCPGAVIHAPAGVGKSRLAREACAAAQIKGSLALWAQATASSATIPLGALASMIPDGVRSDDLLELLRRSTTALQERAGGRAVFLAVDDAQLLDETSAGLVLHLATTAHVFVLATLRAGVPPPDAIDALWKDAGAQRIELERLGDATIGRLLEEGLGGPVEQATLSQLIDASVGNPLYARELVMSAIDEGLLTRERGLWRLRGRPSLPPSLAAVIARRLGALNSAERSPLELLALGEPLRLSEIAELTSYEALERCEERGMISIGGPPADAEVRLAHPLYGDAIRAELPVLRARAHRLALAALIQRRRPLTPDAALRTARWLSDAGAEIPGDLLLDAADAANLACDPALGSEFARRAIETGAGLRGVRLLARAHTIRDEFVEAEAVLAEAEQLARDDAEVLEYLGQRLHLLAWVLGRTDDAAALLRRVDGWSSEDPRWEQQLATWKAGLTGLTEGFGERLQAARDALRQPDLDPTARRLHELILGVALMSTGHGREAAALARQLRPRLPFTHNFDLYALGLAGLAAEECSEDWHDVRAYMRGMLQEAVRGEAHEAAGVAARTLGAIDLHRGRYRDAERWLAEAELQMEDHDSLGGLICVYALQVGVACFTGDPAGARTAVDRMRRRSAERGQRSTDLIYVARAEGWAIRARGNAEGGQAFLQRAETTGDTTVRARLLYEGLRAGARPRPIALALTELAADGDSELTEACAAHANALAGHDGGALVEAGERLAVIGCDAAAVEAIAAGAREFLAQGRQDSARRAATRARELHPADQGWASPEIDGLDGVAVELTSREAQIAALAGRGLSNQQIADQLVLSVRTVETYVYRAMQKRGVGHRREL
jgi:DNA-binding CsgD family transcriptional regulator